MTRASIREYAAAIRDRYLKASSSQKDAILSEFCQATGYHRKSAIRLLRHLAQQSGKRLGRPREYGSEVASALRVAWEATDRICGKRLGPFLAKLVPALERQGELNVSPHIRSQLLQVFFNHLRRTQLNKQTEGNPQHRRIIQRPDHQIRQKKVDEGSKGDQLDKDVDARISQ